MTQTLALLLVPTYLELLGPRMHGMYLVCQPWEAGASKPVEFRPLVRHLCFTLVLVTRSTQQFPLQVLLCSWVSLLGPISLFLPHNLGDPSRPCPALQLPLPVD